ncbi:putative peptidoglycan-binding domain-containing protein [Leptolyngbya sp. PCC 7375]|nr:putative peptidoglycan-binding domain-containing protein [Leptolyngbya sp. PCC 7375]
MTNQEQREARRQRWEGYRSSSYRRWRVYSTFLTGFLIGLFYVILMGENLSANLIITDQRTLILIFSGILGGVIYTILVDGHVEMPRFVANKGDRFQAGLFGDILLGIAGAVVIDFLAESMGLNLTTDEPTTVAAIGIIGGYGGRAILQFALNRIFKDINVLEEDRQKYLKASYQRRLEAMDGLKVINSLNEQVHHGLSSGEVAELTQAIRQAPASIRKQVFDLAKDYRRTANLSGDKARIQRTIPIFEALLDSEPDQHQYYAQLAFACKDAGSPDLFKAIQYLDKAIELRGEQNRVETWKYELSRAITRIQQAYQSLHSYDFDPSVNDRIIEDLLAVAKIYNLENILKDVKDKNMPQPILNWLWHNKAELIAREDTADLAIKLISPTEAGNIVDIRENEARENTQLPELKKPTNEEIIKPSEKVTASTNRKIDREIFFKEYRTIFKPRHIDQEQVNTFDAIFDYWDNSQYSDLRWLAYALATAYHETGGLMVPVREGFAKSDQSSIKAVEKLYAKGRINNNYAKLHPNGKSYFGRGLVQITHGDNYKKLGKVIGLGMKLYDEPSLALDKDISVKLLFKGMIDGLYRPGHKLSSYFDNSKEDWFNARDIINGDKEIKGIGHRVADYGKKFYRCCQSSQLKPSLSKPVSDGKRQSNKEWIEAVRETWLKKSVDPVDLISPEQKKLCVPGTRYGVESYQKAENDHYLVKLAHGAGEWYIFDSESDYYWATSWKNDQDVAIESGVSESDVRRNFKNISITVSEVISGCDTGQIQGLSLQVLEKLMTEKPNVLSRIEHPLIVCRGSQNNPFLQTKAYEALIRVVESRDTSLYINSCLRTPMQQHMLRQQKLRGICGIRAAAKPPKSNHNSGLAIDIEDPYGWRPYMKKQSWKWLGEWDDMHFDYTGGGENLGALQVRAFQQLWNEFNPQELIKVDGQWGSTTREKVNQSPIQGFGKLPVFKKGAFSEAVGEIQLMLRDVLGLTPDELSADNHFGSKTFQAVSAFQEKMGITPIDGIVGQKTLQKLEEETGRRLV